MAILFVLILVFGVVFSFVMHIAAAVDDAVKKA